MVNIFIGILLSTIGMTIINCLCEIITVFTELIKAYLGVKIIKYNKIMEVDEPKEHIHAIGFNTSFEGDDD